MMCAETPALPEGDGWSYEVKLDGYRAMAIKRGDAVALLSRNAKPLRYPQIMKAVQQLPVDSVVLDGELVALDETGRPSFQLLINGEGHLCYYAFDVLHVDGRNVRGIGLELRKSLLQEIVADTCIRYAGPIIGDLDVIVAKTREFSLEGLVAKRKASLYEPGKRSGAWTKMRLNRAQDLVIGGFLPGATVESVLVGSRVGKQLLFAGEVHGGLTRFNRIKLSEMLSPLAITACPFSNLPEKRPDRFGAGITAQDMKRYVWVKPKTIARVEFVEWTKAGRLRHPKFQTLVS